MALRYKDKATTVLEKCERDLRTIAASALQEGAYEIARTIADLAAAIAEHRAGAGLDGGKNVAAPSPHPGNAQTEGKASTAQTRRTGANRYPRFVRRDNRIVKIGWSRTNKREYEHSAPWDAVVAFAAHIRTHTRPGRIFTVDDILPVPGYDTGDEMPDYQLYLSLAWLRAMGFVSKKGRRGYIAEHAALTDEALSRHWAGMASDF